MAKKEEKTLFSTHFLKGVELANWKISTLFFRRLPYSGYLPAVKFLLINCHSLSDRGFRKASKNPKPKYSSFHTLVDTNSPLGWGITMENNLWKNQYSYILG